MFKRVSKSEAMKQENNPFLSNVFPPNFSGMTAENANIAIGEALELANKNLKSIEELDLEDVNFENTIRALDRADTALSEVWTMANHLDSVLSDPKLRELLAAKDEEISNFFSSIPLNEKLWEKVKQVDASKLSGAQLKLFQNTHRDFIQNGANLETQEKEKLRALDAKLASLTRKFSENSIDAQNDFEIHITNINELEGLPEAALNLAQKKAKEKNLEGWLLTLDAPILSPLLSYCKNENLREKLWRAFNRLCNGGKFDNTQLIPQIIEARQSKAKILGKDNFADFILENRMAKNGKTALNFVENLHDKFYASFQKDIAQIQDFAGVEKLKPWNHNFCVEELRQKFYEFDQEEMRPYFQLEKALQGAFDLAQKLFGLSVEKDEAPTWHESVAFYKISDENKKHIASFYADLFPRKGKRSGAWMNLLKDDIDNKPKLGLIAANFNEAANGKPSLLNHDELETLFHEFGHLIHFILMDAPEYGLRDVAWDFVELPSQIMENWCKNLEFLDSFAAHWQSGEKLPRALFEKFDKAKKFRGASLAMRQLSFAKIDLELHINTSDFLNAKIEEKAQEILKPYSQEYTETPITILPHFTHIFDDSVGYAAGYYSYKWAEALDADAFTRFEKEGIFNPQTGRDFADKILKVGETVDEAQAFKNFMGREADPEALVKRTLYLF